MNREKEKKKKKKKGDALIANLVYHCINFSFFLSLPVPDDRPHVPPPVRPHSVSHRMFGEGQGQGPR